METNHHEARWAALTAFFTNLAALKVVAILGPNRNWLELVAAILTAVFVGAGVYSKQRWDSAKEAKEKARRSGLSREEG